MRSSAAGPAWSELHRSLGIPAGYGTERGLKPFPEAAASDLVEVGVNPDGRSVQLIRPTAEAWISMKRAAAQAGLELLPISGFRSVARQAEIIARKLAAGREIAEILRFVAAPGFSEHHTGCAIDIGVTGHLDLEESFAGTPAYVWLSAHAGKHGFHLTYLAGNPHGIGYEPWHWCWHPNGT